MAAVDDNGCPVIYGVSHRDGKTPVQIKFNPNGRRMKMDTVTTIEFDPSLVAGQQNENDVPTAKGTSADNDIIVLPWVVNEDTGAVLVET